MTRHQPPAQVLHDCIARCARYRDGRGRWRAERDCAEALGGRQLDADCAAAARRIGEWLGGLGRYPEHPFIGRAIAPKGIAQKDSPIRATAGGLPPTGGQASRRSSAGAPSITS